MKKEILIYLPAGISLICSGLWYLPWIIDPVVALDYYMMAFLWFLVAWILTVGLVALGIREGIKRNKRKIHFFYSSSIMAASYLIIFNGAGHGYMVTI